MHRELRDFRGKLRPLKAQLQEGWRAGAEKYDRNKCVFSVF